MVLIFAMVVLDVHVGDRVWLDVRQVAFQVLAKKQRNTFIWLMAFMQKNCWVECMMLADGDQNDPLGKFF